MFTDLEGYHSSPVFLASSIPDIAVINNDILDAIELTACFKTNFQKSRKYKTNRYKNLSNEVAGNYNVKKLFIKISTLEFYTNDIKPFIMSRDNKSKSDSNLNTLPFPTKSTE